MRATWRENQFYFIIQLLVLALGGLVLMFYHQGRETLWMSEHHAPMLDYFFVAVTRLAEWQGIVAGAILLLWNKNRHGIVVYAAALSLNGVLTAFLKLYCFPDAVRPSRFFPESVTLNFVPGLEILRQHSFPSGHTSTAFAMAVALGLHYTKGWQQTILLLLAGLVALSRVYLLQHFYRDVYAGAILGTAVALGCFLLVKNRWAHRL
ncbi:MAG: phosphatase PAP2 family protein [Chitinophagales bacterium]